MEKNAVMVNRRAKTQVVLLAKAIPPNGAKGGTRKGHNWVEYALWPFTCEGLNPLSDADARRFSADHDHIQVGQRYLRKIWRTNEGVEFVSRHCKACGREIELCLDSK